MISQEARDLFAANVKAMTAGDAAHLDRQRGLAAQHLVDRQERADR